MPPPPQKIIDTKARTSMSLEDTRARIARRHEALRSAEKRRTEMEHELEAYEEKRVTLTSDTSKSKAAYAVSVEKYAKGKAAGRVTGASLKMKEQELKRATEKHKQNLDEYNAAMAQD